MDKRMEIGLPEKLEVYREGGKLAIKRRWFSWITVYITFFALAWNGFLVFWYSEALSSSNLEMALFTLMHVVIGIGTTYLALAGWFNRSMIIVGGGKVVVRTGPLPWWGNKDLQSVGLKQLYVKEKVRRSRGGGNSTYDLHVITSDGRNLKLMAGFPESEQALFIEQEVERFLGISDAEVKGAVQ